MGSEEQTGPRVEPMYAVLPSKQERPGLGLPLRSHFPVKKQVLDKAGAPCLFLCQPRWTGGRLCHLEQDDTPNLTKYSEIRASSLVPEVLDARPQLRVFL